MNNKMTSEDLKKLKELISILDENDKVFKKSKEIINTKEELNEKKEKNIVKNRSQ